MIDAASIHFVPQIFTEMHLIISFYLGFISCLIFFSKRSGI